MEFEQWFAEQGAKPEEPELPDGMWEEDGNLIVRCSSCNEPYEWPGTAEEFASGRYENMCGGSFRCIP